MQNKTLRNGFARTRTILFFVVGVVCAVAAIPLGQYSWTYVHFSRALAAIDAGDLQSARHHLNFCQKEWPSSAEIRFLSARVARRVGDLDQAHRLLSEAERLGWVREAIDLERALLMAQEGNHRLVGPTLIDFVRRKHPDSALILEILVPASWRAFELSATLTCVDLWVQLEPENPKARVWRGQVFDRLMRYSDAIEDYRKAIELNPTDLETRIRLGGALLSRKLPEEAFEHLSWAYRNAKQDIRASLGYAHCLVDLGRDEEARPILDAVFRDEPDNGIVMMIRGQLEMNARRYDQAETWYRKALKRTPSDPALMYKLSICLQSLKKDEEAAQLQKQMKKHEADLAEAQRLVTEIVHRSADPAPRCNLAVLLLRNGRDEDAVRWVETALSLNPNFAPAYEALAQYYDLKADLKQAKAMRDRAKALAPPTPAPEKPKEK